MNRWLITAALASSAFLTIAAGLRQGAGQGGRTVRLDNEPAGPYLLRALTSPNPPLVGEMYVEVRVQDASSHRVITDVTVRVLASSLEAGGQPLETQASRDAAPTPNEFAAYLPVPESGFWQVTIQVDGPQGQGQAQFLERVSEPSHWIHILTVAAPFLGLLGLGLAYRKVRGRAFAEIEPPGRLS